MQTIQPCYHEPMDYEQEIVVPSTNAGKEGKKPQGPIPD
jgi:hypothetical protein